MICPTCCIAEWTGRWHNRHALIEFAQPEGARSRVYARLLDGLV